MLHIKFDQIGQLASEIFKFESMDDGRDSGPLAYYKLTLWAFGSCELIKYDLTSYTEKNQISSM